MNDFVVMFSYMIGNRYVRALAAIAMAAVIPPVVIEFLNAPAIGAQSPSATQLQFDAASIKPNNSGVGGRGGRGGSVQFTPGKFTGRSLTTRRIILEAYRLTNYQLSGGSGWLDSARFDLDAKAETPANENQLRQMLQTLLSERFKLVVHREAKDMPVYALVVAKNGLKLREVKEGEPKRPPPPIEPGALMVEFNQSNMRDFVDNLSRSAEIGRPVLDKTGLQGIYFFDMQLLPGEDFITMVQERCGLKFESQKATVDVLIIDHIEKPAEN